VGATYLTQFPAFAHDILRAGPSVVSLFLGMFSVGISVGSLICQRLFHGRASLRFAPLGALGMALFGLDFAWSATPIPGQGGAGIAAFLAAAGSWRLLADLFATAVFAGVYVVPLYTLMQQDADPAHRARVIAANNVVNACFMTAAAVAAGLLLAAGLGVSGLLALVAATNLAVAAATWLRHHRSGAAKVVKKTV
jgi:acyl-[acyl-carrier-protein]-phospholipid O-acyltransferase/long-chain-fatty-acid--[acyl-carrier-protein] ligase